MYKKKQVALPKSNIKKYQLVKGMKDIVPEEQPFWSFVKDQVEKIAGEYSYQKIDTPVLESTNLFVRSVGEDTDIVTKEMYSFIDQGGENVTMRPEGTASIVRAYNEHGMVNLPQPVKFFYFGPMFRYDKPQSGRYRQFYQFGFEALGEAEPIIDAQQIFLGYKIFQSCGLNVSTQINSIGCSECRPVYQNLLIDYFKNIKSHLCDDCKKRMTKNPLRILDCKEKKCQELLVNLPQTVDNLCDNCRNHFVRVLEYLDELEVPYILNARIVRGLDYYTRTTFEFWANEEEEGRQNALGGGGRYDKLVELLGGRSTPAVGFAVGVERLITKMHDNDFAPPKSPAPDVFLAQLGNEARKRSLKLFEELKKAGFKAAESFAKNGIKPQLELANRLGVKYSLILGQKEILDKTILIRDMDGGIQEIINFEKIIPELEKRLGKRGENQPS